MSEKSAYGAVSDDGLMHVIHRGKLAKDTMAAIQADPVKRRAVLDDVTENNPIFQMIARSGKPGK